MYARSPSTGHSIPSKMQPHRACQRRSAETPNQQKNTTSPDRHNPVGKVRFAYLYGRHVKHGISDASVVCCLPLRKRMSFSCVHLGRMRTCEALNESITILRRPNRNGCVGVKMTRRAFGERALDVAVYRSYSADNGETE